MNILLLISKKKDVKKLKCLNINKSVYLIALPKGYHIWLWQERKSFLYKFIHRRCMVVGRYRSMWQENIDKWAKSNLFIKKMCWDRIQWVRTKFMIPLHSLQNKRITGSLTFILFSLAKFFPISIRTGYGYSRNEQNLK